MIINLPDVERPAWVAEIEAVFDVTAREGDR
jgi:hypothetical protein